MGSKKISSDTILLVSAIIIATISIIISLWEGIETRKHNRLSVQPRMEIYFDLNYNENMAQLSVYDEDFVTEQKRNNS